MLKIRTLRFSIRAMMLSFLASGAMAHSNPNRPDIDQMIRQSDFIFQGTVMHVQYKMSTVRGSNTDELPHTFVTYRIDRILKGKSSSETITLRFLGGRGKGATFLEAENFPLFDLQDYDVIFVKGNTSLGCPLAQCEAGRFRAIQDLMYSETGREILLTRNQKVGTGRAHELEDVLTHRVSQTIIKNVIVSERGEGDQQEPVVEGKHFHLQEFSEFINARVRQLYTPDQLEKLKPVVSANIQVPFVVRSPRNLPAPRRTVVRPPKPPANESALDKKERETLLQNGGNPVIN